MKGKNKYVILEDEQTVKGTCPSGEEFYFDIQDLRKAKTFTWYSSGSDFLKTCVNIYGKPLYRLLIITPKGFEIDHINRNRMDNRRSNLRICTHQQNQFNQNLQRNNTSGVIGVRFNKTRNKYVARIKFCGRDIHLGYYKNIEHAMQARNEAAKLLFGQFAVLSNVIEGNQEIKNYVRLRCKAVYKINNFHIESAGKSLPKSE